MMRIGKRTFNKKLKFQINLMSYIYSSFSKVTDFFSSVIHNFEFLTKLSWIKSSSSCDTQVNIRDQYTTMDSPTTNNLELEKLFTLSECGLTKLVLELLFDSETNLEISKTAFDDYQEYLFTANSFFDYLIKLCPEQEKKIATELLKILNKNSKIHEFAQKKFHTEQNKQALNLKKYLPHVTSVITALPMLIIKCQQHNTTYNPYIVGTSCLATQLVSFSHDRCLANHSSKSLITSLLMNSSWLLLAESSTFRSIGCSSNFALHSLIQGFYLFHNQSMQPVNFETINNVLMRFKSILFKIVPFTLGVTIIGSTLSFVLLNMPVDISITALTLATIGTALGIAMLPAFIRNESNEPLIKDNNEIITFFAFLTAIFGLVCQELKSFDHNNASYTIKKLGFMISITVIDLLINLTITESVSNYASHNTFNKFPKITQQLLTNT